MATTSWFKSKQGGVLQGEHNLHKSAEKVKEVLKHHIYFGLAQKHNLFGSIFKYDYSLAKSLLKIHP